MLVTMVQIADAQGVRRCMELPWIATLEVIEGIALQPGEQVINVWTESTGRRWGGGGATNDTILDIPESSGRGKVCPICLGYCDGDCQAV